MNKQFCPTHYWELGEVIFQVEVTDGKLHDEQGVVPQYVVLFNKVYKVNGEPRTPLGELRLIPLSLKRAAQ